MSELLSPPPEVPGLRLTQTQKDLVGGSIGGIAQVLVGQVSSGVEMTCQLMVCSRLISSKSGYKPLRLGHTALRWTAPGSYSRQMDRSDSTRWVEAFRKRFR